MCDHDFNRIVDGFKDLPWRESVFDDVEWYYAEEGRYIIHIKAGENGCKPEHFRIVKARNPDQAIRFAGYWVDHRLKEKE